MAYIFRKPKSSREEKDDAEEIANKMVQALSSRYCDSLSGETVPCVSPYPKTRHPRSSIEAWNVDKHINKHHKDLLEDFPFPAGKVRDELAQYEDVDLARLVDNCYRACWMLTYMINQPLSKEILHYYVYVPFPCRLEFERLYRGQDTKTSPSDVPMEWQGMLDTLKAIDRYAPEPLVELILTDMAYRNQQLADEIKQLCQAVVREADETDEYFGRLAQLAYWNEKVYEPPIRRFRACLNRLSEKLNHVGQLYENELKSRPPGKDGQGDIAKHERTPETWYWKLYEITLKVLVDAVMERFWPKPK